MHMINVLQKRTNKSSVSVELPEDTRSTSKGFIAAVRVEELFWRLTGDKEMVINADPQDIIWVDNVNDLRAELCTRYPAPPGFTRVRLRYSEAGCSIPPDNALVDDPHERQDPNDVIEAIKQGYTLNQVHASRPGGLLEHCGYSDEEVKYLLTRSSLSWIPLRDNVVMPGIRSKSAKYRCDEKLYQEACRQLSLSRKRRKKSRKLTSQVTMVMISDLNRELIDQIAKRLNIPVCLWLRERRPVKSKPNAYRVMLELIDWWQSLFGSHSYRQLDQYKEIIRMWACPQFRKNTRAFKSKFPRSDHYQDTACDWLDDELAYCQERGFKFAKPPKDK